jgi:hypothetical protein
MYNDTMSAAMKFGPQQLGTFEMEISSLKLLMFVLGQGVSEFLTYLANSLRWIQDLILT